jgi:acetyltransferase-like isoleucine patch superfamily enzyme
MALVLKDRVWETTVTSGTGTVTLAGATAGYQSFAAIGNANQTYYTIADQSGGANWEVGIGTYTLSGTTLSRDTVLASSNAGALVSFGSNTKDVWCDYPAGRSVIGSQGYTENANTISTTATINTGNNALSAGPVTVSTGVTITVPTGSVWSIV